MYARVGPPRPKNETPMRTRNETPKPKIQAPSSIMAEPTRIKIEEALILEGRDLLLVDEKGQEYLRVPPHKELVTVPLWSGGRVTKIAHGEVIHCSKERITTKYVFNSQEELYEPESPKVSRVVEDTSNKWDITSLELPPRLNIPQSGDSAPTG